VTVAAQPTEILAVISDFARYPEWADSVSTCEVISRHADGSADQVHFVVDAGIVQDDFVLAYTWDESRMRVDWQLVRGRLQRAHTGSYALEPQGRQTKVTYTLSLELAVPMLALFRRRTEMTVIDFALRALKNRVEGGT
jgi:ribosome-associated toxin RatA of RatAB toxin-antitoxin module